MQINEQGVHRYQDPVLPQLSNSHCPSIHKRVNLVFPFHNLLTPPTSQTIKSGRSLGSVSLPGCRSYTRSAARPRASMAASESVAAVIPGTVEGEEETILYDLLVNTEWPPETEVQVNQAPPEPPPAQRRRCPGRAT